MRSEESLRAVQSCIMKGDQREKVCVQLTISTLKQRHFVETLGEEMSASRAPGEMGTTTGSSGCSSPSGP